VHNRYNDGKVLLASQGLRGKELSVNAVAAGDYLFNSFASPMLSRISCSCISLSYRHISRFFVLEAAGRAMPSIRVTLWNSVSSSDVLWLEWLYILVGNF